MMVAQQPARAMGRVLKPQFPPSTPLRSSSRNCNTASDVLDYQTQAS